ncbi:MAG: CCA tRNA nucleotidyltransferase [Candidatus Gracilibacteria bacterium]|nr:CCA tRNA nucleotidyltransferase [Candidatus Gracilibacteria bacterium]
MQKTALQIIKTLKAAGHEAYLAGGCVRDILMKRDPTDYDIATSAKPEEIEKLLEKTIPIGKQFGVILALQNGFQFEIATFRSDSGYSDGRRPDAVLFTSPKEDAKRRDFTINALFYDTEEKKVIDFVKGQKDLKAKVIDFVGDPEERIKEDHLRLIRAIRFKNALGFQYHPETYKAICKYSHLIKKVSPERLGQELNKIMTAPCDKAAAFEDMFDSGVLQHILPEIARMKGVAQPYEYHQEGDVFAHTMAALRSLGAKKVHNEVAWAVLLHDVGKPDTFKIAERIRFDGHVEKSAELAQEILKRLRFSGQKRDQITWLVAHHMLLVPLLEMPLGRQRHWLLHPWFEDLLQVHKADAEGSLPVDLELYHKVKNLLEETKQKLPQLPPKLIAGDELIKKFKLKEGKEVGRLLDLLHYAQLEERVNNKKQAWEFLEEHLKPEILR